ncbi:MAG: thioredoxin family protein [Deltaproteobacteria bacterium]|nr:thioredoxin family protein [Deltaproteobacteria bacterium]
MKKQMNALEEKKIAAWGQTLNDDISIDLTLTRDERSELFMNFCENLNRIAPKIRFRKETEEESGPPVIVIDNVRYQAIPAERELDPFLSLLADQNHLAGQLSSEVRKLLDDIRLPALLKVYIMPLCPFCPTTVMQLLSVAAANEQIKLNVIDSALFPELARSDNVQSAPTVLLENQFRWTGAIQIREVVDMILNRDPSQLSASSLRDMISNGDAAAVADMMIDSGKIFPAFVDLLIHEKWPVRLGAMVAFEAIVEQNRSLAARAIPILWEQFSRVEDTVRGDILFLFGSSGDNGVIPLLESVLNGPYQTDVKEAAAEALEGFKSG